MYIHVNEFEVAGNDCALCGNDQQKVYLFRVASRDQEPRRQLEILTTSETFILNAG